MVGSNTLMMPVRSQFWSFPRGKRAVFACGALVLLLAGVLFYRYGRTVWKPLQLKLTGRRTVAGVLKALEPKFKTKLAKHKGLLDGRPLVLVALKKEQRLELWKRRGKGYYKVKTYRFTAFSGRLGPKLVEGDGQIPEGIYRVVGLNPNSSFHLSIKLNYPNAFDRRMGRRDRRRRLGNNIFIHGNAVTIGCIPIGDSHIEELFYIVGKNGTFNTRVIIAPHDLRKHPKGPKHTHISWGPTLYKKLRAAMRPFQTAKQSSKR